MKELREIIERATVAFADFKDDNDDWRKAMEAHVLSMGNKFDRGDSTPSSGFQNLGDFAIAVARGSTPGGQIDDRLRNIQAASGTNEAIPSEGGFLVGTDLAKPLLNQVFESGQVAKRCNRVPISGGANSIKLPCIDETSRVNGSRWGGIQSYWSAEAATTTATKPKFRQLELNLKKLFGLCYATEELLQDSAALNAVLSQAFTEEMAFKLDDAIINGTGAGQPLGILNSDALVTVAKEAGQDAKTVVFENIVKMYERMPGRSRKNAVWLLNNDIESQLFSMSLSVGTGGSSVYLPGGNVNESPFSTLFGRPVIPIEQCATLGTVGDIIFADPSMYILAEKGGVQPASSIHVRFIYDEQTFRWTLRVDGQPVIAAPLTPYKGANTLSPFVALAARG